MGIINSINDILWTYILIALLLGCALWFTLKTRFVQFRMIGEMVRLLGDSAGTNGKPGEKHISSFQAFAISIASRVGTGNLAGHCHCSRWTGSGVLDVDHCIIRSCQRIRGVYISSII